jgi:HD-GYP domain-containing protein (c-di-GMP phosphodiesterase class II)
VIRRHPGWGDELLGTLGFGGRVRRLVLDHHERLDGSGYPRGLTAEALDVDTRILAVCDVYDALISTRVYRQAWTHDRAFALLCSEAGDKLDARCVAALERVLERGAAVRAAA